MHHDNDEPKPEPHPSTILLACFLCTSSVALMAQAGKNDPYQAYVVCFCAILSTIGGAFSAVDAQDFVFTYLFWGCLGGLGISMVLHRVMAVTAREQKGGQKGGLEKEQAATVKI